MSRPADDPGTARPGHYRPRPQGYRRPTGAPAGGPATGPTRRLHAVGPQRARHGSGTGPVGRAGPGAQHGNRAHPRWGRARVALVGLARILAGGMVVLVLVVLGAPLVLGGPGAGLGAVTAHAAATLVAVAATAVAAHPRVADPIAVAAALVTPVTLIVLLSVYWWI